MAFLHAVTAAVRARGLWDTLTDLTMHLDHKAAVNKSLFYSSSSSDSEALSRCVQSQLHFVH